MIRELKATTDGKGHINHVRLVFGPHHFLELNEIGGKVSFATLTGHASFCMLCRELAR
jgi:hypothetical protein